MRPSRPFARREPVRDDPTEGSGEQRQQAESADRVARVLDRQLEAVEEIRHRDRMDEEFDAEGRAISAGQDPDAVVPAGRFHDVPAALLAGIDRDALLPQCDDVAIGGVLGEGPVEDRDDQHQYAGEDHGVAPAERLAETEARDAGDDERHDALGDAAARIAPAADGRVGGAHHVRREHHRRVILGDDEARADHADQQTEDQERRVVPSKGHAEHRDRAERQQDRVGDPRPVLVAHRSDDHAGQHGREYPGDRDVVDLVLGERQILCDDRHQGSRREPGEEADKEGEPGQVEGAPFAASSGLRRSMRVALVGEATNILPLQAALSFDSGRVEARFSPRHCGHGAACDADTGRNAAARPAEARFVPDRLLTAGCRRPGRRRGSRMISVCIFSSGGPEAPLARSRPRSLGSRREGSVRARCHGAGRDPQRSRRSRLL